MATRNVVLSIGSGPDEPAAKGKMQVKRVYVGPDGDGVLIYDTPETVKWTTVEDAKAELEVDQYYTFTPVKPTGDPITAKIPAGVDDILLSDLAPVNPRSLEAATEAPPAWFLDLSQVQSEVAGIAVDITAAQEAAAAAQATADAAAPQSELNELTLVVGGKADTDALAAVALSGSASDISTGTLPSSVLPPLAVNETFVVASQAAMLGLTAQRGDVAIRSDLTPTRTFILSADAPTVLANWVELTAAGGVQSVAGLTDSVSAGGLKTALALPSDTVAAIGTKQAASTMLAKLTALAATMTNGQIIKWDGTLGEPVAMNPVGSSRLGGNRNATGTNTPMTAAVGTGGGIGAEVVIPSSAFSATDSNGRPVVITFGAAFSQTAVGTCYAQLFLYETTGGIFTKRATASIPAGASVPITIDGEWDGIGVVTTTRTFELRARIITTAAAMSGYINNSTADPTYAHADAA